MNSEFSHPSSKNSDITERKTMVIMPELHTRSMFYSIPRRSNNYCYLVTCDKPGGVYVRRYWCPGCVACKQLNFLGCTSVDSGKWTFHTFRLKRYLQERRIDKIRKVNDEKHLKMSQPSVQVKGESIEGGLLAIKESLIQGGRQARDRD